jgi:hypothetical protein
MYHLLIGAFCIGIISVNGINQLILVIKKRCVLFEVGLSLKYCLDVLRLQRVKDLSVKNHV